MPWDAHKEHKEEAASARERLAFVLDGQTVTASGSVGKHRARNWQHLKEVYAEARESCPRAADTIAWLLWWDIGDADRLAALTDPNDPTNQS